MINRFFVQYKLVLQKRRRNLTPALLYNTKAEDKVYYIY